MGLKSRSGCSRIGTRQALCVFRQSSLLHGNRRLAAPSPKNEIVTASLPFILSANATPTAWGQLRPDDVGKRKQVHSRMRSVQWELSRSAQYFLSHPLPRTASTSPARRCSEHQRRCELAVVDQVTVAGGISCHHGCDLCCLVPLR